MRCLWVPVGGLILLVLGLLNLLLLNQNRTLQARFNGLGAQLNRPTDQALLLLTSANLPISQLTLISKGEESYHPPLSLLVFLSQHDCHACLEEAEVWEKLHKRFSANGFLVLGIVSQEDAFWAEQFSKDYELTFSVRSLDSATLGYLGVPRITPFKVMVDSLHRVVWLSGPNSEPEEQKNFAEVAEKLCQVYLPNKAGP